MNFTNFSNHFNYRRALLLLRKDLIGIWRIVGTVVLIIATGMFLRAYINVLFYGNNTWNYESALTNMGWPLWFITTSLAFTELGDKNRVEGFLLLPVSPLEKFLTRIVIVSILYPLFFIIFYNVIINLIDILLWFLHGQPIRFHGTTLSLFIGPGWIYLTLAQAIVLVGAVWFRKWHLIRTLLAVLLILILLIIWSLMLSFLFRDLLGGDLWGHFGPLSFFFIFSEYHLTPYFTKALGILLILSCWWLAWLRFREAQSSDAI